MSEPVHYPGITSCGCPYIKQRDPSKHWKECHYSLNCERDAPEQQASQGGEAVDRIGYAWINRYNGGVDHVAPFKPTDGGVSYGEPLMTVAQHQRILAASFGNAEPVAYGRWAEGLPRGTRLMRYDGEPIVRCEKSASYNVPLYTNPADQVAEPVDVVVRRDALKLALSNDPMAYLARAELRALLATPSPQ